MFLQGEWIEDNFVGDYGACDAGKALATAERAEIVAEQARDFMYKPDGDVGYKMGLALEQEPQIYAMGSEYLMPGPAGNLRKVPDDPRVRQALVAQARRALSIWRSCNFPLLDIEPDEPVAAPPPPPPLPAAPVAAPRAAARSPVADADDEDDEDDDEEEEDEEELPPVAVRNPFSRRSGTASLTLSAHAMSRQHPVVAAAIDFLARRAVRRPRLGRH